MGGMRTVLGEAIPSTVMFIMEFCTISLTIMAKTIISRGMSPFVFVVYTNALGSILLLLYSCLCYRNQSEQPLLSFQLLPRVFLLGLIGITVAQNLAFLGLSYGSPIVACGMGNLIPAFSFILAIIIRRKENDWKSLSSQVKAIGTVISFVGAASVALYKGPVVKQSPLPSFSLQLIPPPLLIFSSPQDENWILGCVLLAAASVAISVWNIIQVGTVEKYPQVMKIVSLYSLVGTLLSAILSVIIERDVDAWKLKLDMELLVIILTGIFGSVIRSSVHLWCMQKKGPLFASIFKPVGIPIASMFGCFLFADTFHYGSIIGALACGLGHYTLIWGQIMGYDEAGIKNHKSRSSPSDDQKTPLLQQEDSQV
ncbi:unnamed protein product [Coffea canephora]|uniref:WAT1-related protein n=1 Tax=Coffea canephora TaxID=49390 RepID=A0A068TVF1_COFCA|nr:unnamed protein product [Coffea canephora]